MSLDKSSDDTGSKLDTLPEFSLECEYDDWEDPEEVIIYSTNDEDNLYTAYISAEEKDAVSLEDVR